MASAGPGPYTRSRTSLFLSYRDSAARSTSPSAYFSSASKRNGAASYDDFDPDDADESKRLMAEVDVELGIGGASSPKGALPPRWVDIADRVDDIVDKVKPKIAHLDKLHAKHILPGFKDRTAEEREIETLASDITRDFRMTQKYIRQIAEMSKLLLTSGGASETKRVDLIMAANVQTALATKVQELSGVFRKKQTAYLRQLKGQETRNSDSTAKDPLASLADDEQYSQSFLQAPSPSQSQSQLYAFPATLDLQRRDQEISHIAQSITDLADMFKDLSSLVIDQGTLLDRVDWNVEQMGVEVRGAVEELKIATTYQRRSGKCQLIFLLLLLVAGALIVLIYRPSHASSSISLLLPTPDSDIDRPPPPTPTEPGVVGISGGGGELGDLGGEGSGDGGDGMGIFGGDGDLNDGRKRSRSLKRAVVEEEEVVRAVGGRDARRFIGGRGRGIPTDPAGEERKRGEWPFREEDGQGREERRRWGRWD